MPADYKSGPETESSEPRVDALVRGRKERCVLLKCIFVFMSNTPGSGYSRCAKDEALASSAKIILRTDTTSYTAHEYTVIVRHAWLSQVDQESRRKSSAQHIYVRRESSAGSPPRSCLGPPSSYLCRNVIFVAAISQRALSDSAQAGRPMPGKRVRSHHHHSAFISSSKPEDRVDARLQVDVAALIHVESCCDLHGATAHACCSANRRILSSNSALMSSGTVPAGEGPARVASVQLLGSGREARGAAQGANRGQLGGHAPRPRGMISAVSCSTVMVVSPLLRMSSAEAVRKIRESQDSKML